MTPEQMMRRLSSLQTAADIIDAIDAPHTQSQQGLDVTDWRYQLVNWGVLFRYEGPQEVSQRDILVRTGLDGTLVMAVNSPRERPRQ